MSGSFSSDSNVSFWLIASIWSNLQFVEPVAINFAWVDVFVELIGYDELDLSKGEKPYVLKSFFLNDSQFEKCNDRSSLNIFTLFSRSN